MVRRRAALALGSLLFGISLHAGTQRLVSTYTDLSEVSTLYIRPGLVSVVQFPGPITEVKIGDPEQLKAVISKTLSSELTLFAARGVSHPTNLVVRCSRRVFVFDVIFSVNKHRDLYFIRGGYGAPEALDGSREKVIDSSYAKPDPSDRKLELIDSSLVQGELK